MEINGVNIIFIAPLALLILLAIGVGAWRARKRGARAATVSVMRVIVYGGFVLFILFFVWVGLYYAGSGH